MVVDLHTTNLLIGIIAVVSVLEALVVIGLGVGGFLAYRRVMQHFPGPAGGYVYVADNPRKDFLAPRALGWRTLRVRRPGGEHAGCTAAPQEAAEREIASLLELDELLRPNA